MTNAITTRLTATRMLAGVTLVLGLSLPALSRAGSIFFDDFNGYANLAAMLANYTTTTGLGLTNNGGINASQAITNSGDASFFQKANTLSLANGPATISLLFRWNGGGTACPALAFSTTTGPTFTGTADVGGRLNGTPALVVRTNNHDAAVSGTSLSLTVGNWYELDVTVTRTATANTFNITMTLYNSSSAGTRGTQLDTLTAAGASPTIYSAANVEAGVRESKSGTTMDNLSVSQVPAAPANLAATPGSGQVALSWGAVTSLGSVTYNIKRGTSSGGESLLTTVAIPSYTDTGVNNDTTYYYKVSAVSTTLGEGADSSEAYATPSASTPPVPTGVAAVATNGSVTVSWSTSTGAASYNVKRGTANDGTYTVTNSVTAPTTTFVDNTVANGTTYYYAVSALNVGGESADSSPEVSATPLPPPAAPASLTATPGNYQVALTWPASTTSGANAANSYNVKRSTTMGAETNFANVTGTSYTDSTAISGTTYYYEVSAVSTAFGEGPNSTEASTAPTGLPQTPTGVSAQPGPGYITVLWTAPLGTPTSYNVKRSTTSGSESFIGSATTTNFVDASVSPGTTYFYKVSAVNATGEGADSAETGTALLGSPTLKVRLPFDEVNSGSSYYIASDTSNGGANVILTNYNYVSPNYVLADLSGAANSGVGANGAAHDQTSVASQGGAPDLGAYVASSPALALGTVTNWTASVWFKANRSFAANSAADLFVIGSGGTTYAGLGSSVGLRLLSTNQISYRINNSTERTATLPGKIQTNAWYFVGASFDGANLNIYIGSDSSPATLAATVFVGLAPMNFGASGNLLIGNNIQSKTEAFAGWIDDFRFYSGPGDANYIESIRTSALCVPPTMYTVGGGGEFCSGGSTTVTLSGSQSGVTYQLYNGVSTVDGTTAGTGSPLSWSVTAPGTYTVQTTTAGGYCATAMSGSAVVAVDSLAINSGATATPSAASPGSTVNISVTASATGGTGLTYQWYKDGVQLNDGPTGTGSTNSGATTATLSIANVGASDAAASGHGYTCVVSGGNACGSLTSAEATLIVACDGSLSATAGAAATPICAGSALSLTGSASGGSGSGYTYSWTGPNGFSSLAQNPAIPNATPLASGTYYLTVTDSGGCTAPSQVTATVNPLPITSAITGTSTVSANQAGVHYSVTLTSGSSYAWTVPADASISSGASGPNNNEIVVTFGTSSGNVGVVETSAAGCAGSPESLAVSVQNTLPVTIGRIHGTSLDYSGGAGANFVLLASPNVHAPMSGWTPVDTNSASPGTFTIPAVGSSTQLFYRIQSE